MLRCTVSKTSKSIEVFCPKYPPEYYFGTLITFNQLICYFFETLIFYLYCRCFQIYKSRLITLQNSQSLFGSYSTLPRTYWYIRPRNLKQIRNKHIRIKSKSFFNLLEPELFFFLILAHSVYKMWIIQVPNKLALWNKLHFEEKNRRV